MHGQLMLWNISVDLSAKIKAEREAGVQVFYHFCGAPLSMDGSQRPTHAG